ncbi:heterokaryon incompatibility protein-domain-containing protein [Thelonectria olida]|uniref:Heterokaryon incompatibility protein-domain-containing protein n=1 Tax=Thelonectria olida TaxID=1576542 RepID=A0A9P8W3L6_9HYPO|nr:heterokaryon incompatibility protein-domain-containing protein [Thelonectria olida]
MSASPEEDAGFCWKCQALLNAQYPQSLVVTENDETRREPNKKHMREIRTSDPIEATASGGCLLCLHLLHSLETPSRTVLQRLSGATEGEASSLDIEYEHGIFINEGQPPCISLHVRVKSENSIPELESGSEIKTLIQLFPEAETAPFVNPAEIHGSTNSDACRAMVTDWLDRCVQTHKRCALPLNAKTLPSRVIDLSSGTPRLLVTRGATPALPYATMSHCWGSSVPLRLLSSNMVDLQAEIPVTRLSQSFRDALQVVRWLGLSYIWIDSLCIIQDSAQDWEKESASMAQVYSNSYCNIAAAHAADGTYGCFTERDTRLVKPLKLDLHWGPAAGSYYAIQWLYWRQKVMETPLNTRAWVCQERYLAPRNLFFGETQLFWQCCECAASETFPTSLPPGAGGLPKSLDPHVNGASKRRSCGLSEVPELDAFSLWDSIVYTYSTGKLTYSEDKLVAISGLASRMQKHTQSEYLAGLWRRHLPYQLLWTVGGIQWVSSRERPAVYTAPSWSWASMHGTVEDACVVRHADEREIILEILDAKVDLVSDVNPFGRVKGGYIRAKGHLARNGVHLQESPNNRGSFRLLIQDQIVGRATIDNYEREVAPVTLHGLYYLPVRYNAKLEEVTQNGVRMLVPGLQGLILETTSSNSGGKFVRVGTFNIAVAGREFQAVCRQYSAGSTQVGAAETSKEWGSQLQITII